MASKEKKKNIILIWHQRGVEMEFSHVRVLLRLPPISGEREEWAGGGGRGEVVA
jgi:hypothetical protein